MTNSEGKKKSPYGPRGYKKWQHNTVVLNPTDRLYFAYGSNMNPHRMAGRLGREIPPVATAILKGWKLNYTAGYPHKQDNSFANIKRTHSKRNLVRGVVYHLTESDLQALDYFEGVSRGGYRRQTVPLRIDNPICWSLDILDNEQEHPDVNFASNGNFHPMQKGQAINAIAYIAGPQYQLTDNRELPVGDYVFNLAYGASYFGIDSRYIRRHILRLDDLIIA